MIARSALWSPPEPALAAAAAEGEWAVAKVRLLATAILLISPSIAIIREPGVPIHAWSFGVAVVAVLAAVAVMALLRSGAWDPAIGFASSTLDVSLVTAALVTFAGLGSPLDALNAKVAFEVYFLAIAATGLRYDPRICLATGAIAVVQYGALWLALAWRHDLSDPSLVTGSGAYVPLDQVMRLFLLGAAVILATTLGRRAQRLQFASSRDRLTNVHTRLHFERALEVEIARARRFDQPLALAILAIDHFKSITDEFGLPAGDGVLRAIGARLVASVRRTDIVARHGGEEFVILMTETTSAQATEGIERLRQKIAAEPTAVSGERAIAVGFSAGVAGISGRDDRLGAATLLDRADARLMAARQAGGGRTLGDARDAPPGAPPDQPAGAN